MKKSRLAAINPRLGGFSLIEVTMALGITAMVLVPLLALLPHSMKNMREAIDVSISSRILEEIASEAQLMAFDDLDKLDNREGGMRGYDVGGNALDSSSDEDVVYTARIDVEDATGRNSAVRLPRSTLETSRYARRISIDVAVTRGLQFDFDDPENFRSMQSMVTIVSKMRDDLDVEAASE